MSNKTLNTLVLFFLLLLQIIGCNKKDKNVPTAVINPIDSTKTDTIKHIIDTSYIDYPVDPLLKQKLIGGWQLGNYSIFFYEDGTYIDSSFNYPYFEYGVLNACTKIKRGELFLNQVTRGLYKIENGLLKMQPLEYLVDCNPMKAPGCRLYFDQRAEIVNDTLKLATFFTWQKKDGVIAGIWKSWESNYWAWSYHTSLPPGGSTQLITEYITFYFDSIYYHEKQTGLPYDGQIFRMKFNYEPPLLSRSTDYRFFIVSFKNNEMYWYENKQTMNYKRIK